MGKSDATEWDARRLRLAVKAAGVGLWSWNVDSDKLSLDEGACSLWSVPDNVEATFGDLSARMHPADRDRVRAAFVATRALVGPYEIDFRIVVGDEIRWISARGQGNDADIVNRLMFGIFLDVTGRKQAEESNELVAGEMSHRVKNLLTIASGLTAVTSRSTATTTDMARELTQRLTALGRAHDLVRPAPGHVVEGALLADLFTVLLAPYDDMTNSGRRIRVSIPRINVCEAAATTLALVVHELATNSLKYGALSTDTGTIDVSCTSPDNKVVITWTERGGPLVTAPVGPLGYGSKLMKRSMTLFGGSLDENWDEAGVIATLRMSVDSLVV